MIRTLFKAFSIIIIISALLICANFEYMYWKHLDFCEKHWSIPPQTLQYSDTIRSVAWISLNGEPGSKVDPIYAWSYISPLLHLAYYQKVKKRPIYILARSAISSVDFQYVQNYANAYTHHNTVSVKEVENYVSVYLSRNWEHEELIDTYLNQSYFGKRCNGLKAAAKEYLNKEVDALTIEETAILCVLPYGGFRQLERSPDKFLSEVNEILLKINPDRVLTELPGSLQTK